MGSLIRVEFHCHTCYSPDSLVELPALIETCMRKGIDRLVITDHNTIEGALLAREMAPELVIVGEEIMTQKGELLAAFVRKEIPPGLPPDEAIAMLRMQGAFISVSHPFDRWRKGHWPPEVLCRILPLVDAIETFNARCMWPGANRQAEAFARDTRVLGTVGSDAHTLVEVGRATMCLPDFSDAESLRRALPEGKLYKSASGLWVHFLSRYAVWRKGLKESAGN